MQAPLPPDEDARMAALREYNILDSEAEQAFDDITLLASQICSTPIAMVSFVDAQRQWFKSKVGIEQKETTRDVAFCAHAILHPHETMVVPDATKDPRFSHNQLVTFYPHVRFYAGEPLLSSEGKALGTLCVIDRTPRQLEPVQIAALRALSRQLSSLLDLRRQTARLAGVEAERDQLKADLADAQGKIRVLCGLPHDVA